MANRIGPTPSEGGGKGESLEQLKSQSQGKRIVEKVERIKEVGEVDPDERRAQKFQRALDEAEVQLSRASRKDYNPSPFEASFYAKEVGPSLGALEEPKGAVLPPPSWGNSPDEEPLPSPGYSPPPNLASPPPVNEEESPSSLPRSKNFWSSTDEPPDQPLPKKNFKEAASSPLAKKGEEPSKGETLVKDKKKGAPLTPYEKEKTVQGARPLEKELQESGLSKKNGGKEPQGPSTASPPPPFIEKGVHKKGEEPLPPSQSAVHSLEEKEREKGPPSSWARPAAREEEPKNLKDREIPYQKEKGLSPFEKRAEKPEKEKAELGASLPKKVVEEEARRTTAERREKQQGEKRREERPIEIEGPSLPPLPPEIIPLAQMAAAQAAPYISPQTTQLYFQMVGNLLVMASPNGVTRVEVVLNNPNYANSRFFGATILIEKYATAPDSFNIRLTGSNEAVQLFNQNIPNLMAAFRKGNFSFQINRIDASYERPVFRRKERGDTDKGMDMDKERK